MLAYRMFKYMVLVSFLTGMLVALAIALIREGNNFWIACNIGIYIGASHMGKILRQFKQAIPEDLKKE